MAVVPLKPKDLYCRCDPEQFDFNTTADLEASKVFIGQPRAIDAVRFGIGIRRKGYNMFAFGSAGTGKYTLIRSYIAERAATETVPSDWCYVYNFEDAHKPWAMRLPPGKGAELKHDMEVLLQDLHGALIRTFESDEYRTRTQSVEEALEERQEKAMEGVQALAKEKDIALVRTPTGFTLGPVRDGNVLGPDEFHELPKEEREKIEADIKELQEELRKALQRMPQWQKQTHEEVGRINREMAAAAVKHLLGALRDKYGELPVVIDYLQQVENDVVDNFRHFLPDQEKKAAISGITIPQKENGQPWHHRYRINVLLAHERDGGAPVVYEDLPAYNNLVGRIEHRAHLGALETDFTMVRPGALHRANGGYLILDALKVLLQPFAWETLKRVLQSGEIRIESLAQIISLISTESLEPEPIPLDVKVVLLGERHIYYLLTQLDPEFADLFKVAVDFDDQMERDADSNLRYARLIASLLQRDELRALDRAAVARTIEHSARLADDSERLTSHMRAIVDLIREADYWAGENGRDTVTSADVQQAIDAQVHRADRIRQRLQEEVERGNILIDTSGDKVGQVNGLAVYSLGGFGFGRPSRITARARLGKGQVVDIEREVELGGPIHSKGVLILAGFLAGRYALDYPLSLSASLVFEQSYGGVEGDSASSAELYALLSALADAPVRQSLAVTGSVNQLGQVQAVGGVNEKIEGFFDICKARGLTGRQGALIPTANVKHLMLRADVVDAVEQGRFAVYPVSHVNQGMEILTDLPAGERDAQGRFPEHSLNHRVEAKLIRYSERLRALSAGSKSGNSEPKDDAQ